MNSLKNENQHSNIAVTAKPVQNLIIVAHYTVTETKNVIFLMVEKDFKGTGIKQIFPSAHYEGEKLVDLFTEIALNKTGRLIPESKFRFKFTFEDKDNIYNIELHAVQEESTEEWTVPGETLVHMSYYQIHKYKTTELTRECADIIFKVHLKLKPVVSKK